MITRPKSHGGLQHLLKGDENAENNTPGLVLLLLWPHPTCCKRPLEMLKTLSHVGMERSLWDHFVY